MTPEQRAAAALGQVELRIDEFVSAASARAARHSPHYGELWHAVRIAVRGGKRVRPRLLLTSYAQLCGRDDDAAVQLAVAIELLHTALILHDDVIDGDVERRGAPNLAGTFSAAARAAGIGEKQAGRWGDTAGILAGDLLLTGALRLGVLPGLDRARSDRIAQLLDESIFRAAAGELADVAYASRLSTPSVGDIREMMADKTAHYSLELPLRAAAVLGDAPAELEEHLGAIGRSLGILFQMQDDLLGVFGRPAETGKSATGDLREGKQTLLVAFARDTPAWLATADAFGDAHLDEAGADRLRAALEASGARATFEAEIRREHAHALRLVSEAQLPPGLEAALLDTADQVMERRA